MPPGPAWPAGTISARWPEPPARRCRGGADQDPGAVVRGQGHGVLLVILVPLNWLIFRTLGRVEWAWVLPRR